MFIKVLLAVLLGGTVLISHAERRDPDLKQAGLAALNVGHYNEAYIAWWSLATLGGDREVQELASTLLFSEKAKFVKIRENKKVLALQFLYRSALNGQVSAMRKMAAGSKEGTLGLVRKTFAIQVPGLPPQRAYDIAVKAYGRYGIEYVVIGDAPKDGDIEFMEAFNTIMAAEITARHGADVFEKIQKEIDARTRRGAK